MYPCVMDLPQTCKELYCLPMAINREPGPEDVAAGARIRELREASGWNQAALARQMGVHATLVSHIETARRPATPASRVLVARTLGVPLGAIWGPEAEYRKALAAKLGIPAESLAAAS